MFDLEDLDHKENNAELSLKKNTNMQYDTLSSENIHNRSHILLFGFSLSSYNFKKFNEGEK